MMGNIFAGTEESPGEIINYEGKTYKLYRGMGSEEAMKKGSGERYFQPKNNGKFVPEGISGRVSFDGKKLGDVVFQFVGGLRAGMGYLGCRTIKELQENAQFVEITTAGLKESHPHDVQITRESSNYF
jgi:IMP dehydrogenase